MGQWRPVQFIPIVPPLRHEAIHVLFESLVVPASATLPPDSQAEYEELVLAVHRAVLTKLPHPLRQIVDRVLEDQSPGQIARDLQVSPVTVRTRLMRARWILRRELVAYIPCCGLRARPECDRDDGCADRVGAP